VAHPDTTVQIASRHLAVRARIANSEERARLWPKAVEVYPGYETYRRRTDREIPLVILEPRH
jgi:deazaflavin-dependent oxidoreductase (nitroreductase family)